MLEQTFMMEACYCLHQCVMGRERISWLSLLQTVYMPDYSVLHTRLSVMCVPAPLCVALYAMQTHDKTERNLLFCSLNHLKKINK